MKQNNISVLYKQKLLMKEALGLIKEMETVSAMYYNKPDILEERMGQLAVKYLAVTIDISRLTAKVQFSNDRVATLKSNV